MILEQYEDDISGESCPVRLRKFRKAKVTGDFVQ
jgi:hypothetical protein